jgi:phosphatidylglycerol:prolipoprotein diacylglycerol transferase
LLGFFFGWLLCRSRAERYGIGKNHLDNIALLLPITGLFGARLFARLFYAKLPLLEALKVWEGDGLVFYGGFIVSALAVIVYGLVRKLQLVRLLDCVAPSVALGLAFGRIGCFLAGCCWGDVCIDHTQVAALKDQTVAVRIQTFPAISPEHFALAVQFPQKSDIYKQHVRHGLITAARDKSLPVHPVQLYEAALAALLCFYAARPRLARPGDVALIVLVGYALIRFATEFLRADNKVYALGMTFSQVVSVYILLGCAIIGAIRALVMRRNVPSAVAQVDEPIAFTSAP